MRLTASGWGAIACLLLPVLLAGWGPLYNETDGQYASAARTMAEGGSWLVPENNGVPRLVKPPLQVWAMAVAMSVLGPTDFAARLPGALSVSLCALAIFGIGRRWGGEACGRTAALVYLTSLGNFTLGRIVMPEPMFTAFIACSIWCIVEAQFSVRSRRRSLVCGFWIFAGLASFAKGPHGLLYPLAAVAASVFSMRRTSGTSAIALRELLHPWGLAAVLAINLPWYLAIESRFPGYLANLFVAEHIGHLAATDSPATGRGNVPRPLFLMLQAAWFLPWSAALVGCRRPRLPAPRQWSFATWVIAWWAALVFASVLLAGQRQDYYAMSGWPAVALLLAGVLDGSHWARSRRAVALVLGLAAAGAIAAPFLLAGVEAAPLAQRDTAWNTVMQLGGDAWRSLAIAAAAGLLPAVAVVFLLRSPTVAIAAAGALLAAAAVAGTAIVAPFFSAQPIADTITNAVPPDGAIVFDGDVDTGSSLLFYTGRTILLVGANPASDFVVRTTGIGRSNYLDEPALRSLFAGSTPAVLVTDAARLGHWQTALGARLLTQTGTTLVLANPAAEARAQAPETTRD
jgi:4-amino-4-deoxy-L-arabinose transferase-like glycosyltransferase